MRRSYWVVTALIAIAVIFTTFYYNRDVAAEAPEFTTAEVSRGDVVANVEAAGTLEARSLQSSTPPSFRRRSTRPGRRSLVCRRRSNAHACRRLMPI